ncbi:MAG: GntR family transcriptional regulator [Kiritimatiellia bacterium]|jgi:DNA-binding LacI/PurR family transcriptional regulator
MHRIGSHTTSQERVARALREQLANGVWTCGERIPTEMTLSEALGVSRPTLRAALARLEDEGLLENRGRRGRVVARSAQRADNGVMSGTVVVATHRSLDAKPGDHGGTIDAIESGMLDEASARGLSILRLHRDRLTPETCTWLRENRPAGLVLTAQVAYLPVIAGLASTLLAAGIPVVSNEAAPGLDACDQVLFDHAGGAAALVRWFVAQGCRRILPFWSTTERGVAWLEDRERGCRNAVLEAGLAPLEPIRCDLPARGAEGDGSAHWHRTRHVLGYLYEELARPDGADAVMLLEDGSVYPFLGACRIAGWRVGPGGIRVSGFDDFWAECWERSIEPLDNLATVDKQNHLAGREIVRLLADRNGLLPPGSDPIHRIIPSLPSLP